MTMTIKKKLRKHKIIGTLKELAEGFVFGVGRKDNVCPVGGN